MPERANKRSILRVDRAHNARRRRYRDTNREIARDPSGPALHRGNRCHGSAHCRGWYNLGLTPEEIAAKIEHLTLAQIHAALAYYHANRDEIDSDIATEEAAIEDIFPKPAR
jgi:hypothetical protein